MPDGSDAELALRAQRGDAAAFAELFERLHRPLMSYIYHMVGDRQQAEDIGHDAFLRAYERLSGLGPPWDFKAWLYRIAGNLALDWLRRRNRWVEEEEGMLEDEPPTTRRPVERKAEREEQRRRVENALEGMPTVPRQALILRHVVDLSYEEMGRAMGCSPAAARQRVHRARLRFRDAFGLAIVIPGIESSCRSLGDLLSGYHDNELSAREARLVDQHLSTCGPCSEAIVGMQRVGGMVAGLPSAPGSPVWRERVLRDTVGRRGISAPTTGEGITAREPGGTVGAKAGGSFGVPSVVSTAMSVAAGLAAGAGVALCALGSGALLFQPFRGPSVERRPVTPSVTATWDDRYFAVDESGVTRYQTSEAPPPPDPPIGGTAPPDPTFTATGLPPPVEVVVLQNANCRAGPATAYRVLTSVQQGWVIRLVGRNPTRSWWAVQVAGLPSNCWIFGEYVEVPDLTVDLPIMAAPPLPTATSRPSAACLVWVPNLQKSVCTQPCPSNAQPGSPCEP